MTIYGHHDFEWETPDGRAETPDVQSTSTPAEPIIIVEYRSRGFSGLLVPPAVILALAVLLVAYRPQLATWFTPAQPPRPASARPAVQAEPVEPPPPIVLEVKPLPIPPAPTEEPPALALADVEVEAEELDLGTDRPDEPEVPAADLPEPDPDPAPVLVGPIEPDVVEDEPAEIDPEIVAQRAHEEILRESERIQAEKAEMARLRARQAEVDRLRNLQAEEIRLQQAREAQIRAQKGRDAFRAELLQALRRHGDRAGPHILEIAERYHVEPGMTVEQAIKDTLSEQRAGKLGRSQRVAILRAHGLPEPLVLGDLIHLEERRAQGSNLRRTAAGRANSVNYGAVVRATRQLLALPPDSPPIPTGHAALMPGPFGVIGQ